MTWNPYLPRQAALQVRERLHPWKIQFSNLHIQMTFFHFAFEMEGYSPQFCRNTQAWQLIVWFFRGQQNSTGPCCTISIFFMNTNIPKHQHLLIVPGAVDQSPGTAKHHIFWLRGVHGLLSDVPKQFCFTSNSSKLIEIVFSSFGCFGRVQGHQRIVMEQFHKVFGEKLTQYCDKNDGHQLISSEEYWVAFFLIKKKNKIHVKISCQIKICELASFFLVRNPTRT